MMVAPGDLLIAHPQLPKENPFYNSVVLVYDHSEAGVGGVILNKPLSMRISTLMHHKGVGYGDHKPKLRYGGPINTNSIIMLHTNEWTSNNTIPIDNRYSISSDAFMFEKLAMDEPIYWRMFTGFSGWHTRQLEMEMRGEFPYTKENSWLTAKANDALMFELDEDAQYEKALTESATQMFEKFI